MTGVMIFMYRGLPCIFADTVLTARVPMKSEFSLPSAGHSGVKSDNHPVGLCQKIVSITPMISYVWCGRLAEAQIVHKKILDTAQKSDEEFLEQSLFIEIEHALHELTEETTISVIIRQKNDSFRLISNSLQRIDADPFDIVITDGTGGGAFFSELITMTTRLPSNLKIENMTESDSDLIIRLKLLESILQSRFIFNNFADLDTGGIIESASFAPGSIYKSPTSLFVVWDEELHFPFSVFPFLIIKKFYENGFLYVSYYNYLTKSFIQYSIGHPGCLDAPSLNNPSRFDPLGEPVDTAFTIRFRQGGNISHRQESPEIIMKHFAYSAALQIVLVSQWYHQDALETRNRSDKIEYPY